MIFYEIFEFLQYTVAHLIFDLYNCCKTILYNVNIYLQLNVAHKLKSRLKLEHCPTFSETVELSFATGPKSLQKHADLFRYVLRITNNV